MEIKKPSFVVNGGMKLPIGYRFHPTDEELVVHYLRRKAFGAPLPASVIPDLDVFKSDPWSLPGDLKEKRYFFSKKRGDETESNRKIAVGSGYWRPIGKTRQIISSTSNQTVGVRKTLVFCERDHSNKSRTQWIMHQYRLVGSGTIPNINKILMGDWVVHVVFQRKRRTKRQGTVSSKTQTFEVINDDNPSFMDFIVEESSDGGPPQPSSPSLISGISDASTNSKVLTDLEEISSFFSFSSYNSCNKNT